MIEYQKYTHSVNERDLKSLNKAIFEMPKDKENVKDIVKEPQRNIPIDESRFLSKARG